MIQKQDSSNLLAVCYKKAFLNSLDLYISTTVDT